MLRQRMISAVIALPLLISFLAWAPRIGVAIFFTACVLLSIFETARLIFLNTKLFQTPPTKIWLFIAPLYGAFVFFSATFLQPSTLLQNGVDALSLVVCSLLFLIPLGVFFRARNADESISQVLSLLFSMCYGCLPWLSLWKLYEMGEQARFLLLLLAIIMMSDSGAYFVGMKFGKRRLAPMLSPKKSWEGLAGGVFCAVIGGQVLNLVFSFALMDNLVLLAVISIVTAIAGVIGDLIESALKRFANVKDSGQLIPGHGGFLDRADALIFAGPVLWFMLSYSPVILKCIGN